MKANAGMLRLKERIERREACPTSEKHDPVRDLRSMGTFATPDLLCHWDIQEGWSTNYSKFFGVPKGDLYQNHAAQLMRTYWLGDDVTPHQLRTKVQSSRINK